MTNKRTVQNGRSMCRHSGQDKARQTTLVKGGSPGERVGGFIGRVGCECFQKLAEGGTNPGETRKKCGGTHLRLTISRHVIEEYLRKSGDGAFPCIRAHQGTPDDLGWGGSMFLGVVLVRRKRVNR